MRIVYNKQSERRAAMAEFYEVLVKELEKALVKELWEIRRAAGDEKIYAAALLTDSGCTSVSLYVNTLEHLSRTLGGNNSDEAKWKIESWGYSDRMNGRKSLLARSCQMLLNHDKKDHNEHLRMRDVFIETAASAFRRAILKHPLTADPDDVTYFISISDSDGAKRLENFSSKMLNSKAVYKEFFKRA